MIITHALVSADTVPGRCGNCRAFRRLRFFDFVRRVGTWFSGGHYLYCDGCVNDCLTGATDESVIRDERKKEGETNVD